MCVIPHINLHFEIIGVDIILPRDNDTAVFVVSITFGAVWVDRVEQFWGSFSVVQLRFFALIEKEQHYPQVYYEIYR
jgi:hypothetical protein